MVSVMHPRTFFQKEPDSLNIEEAALLVGMLKGNTIYNPSRNPKAALDRRNVVIDQMAENGKITAAEAAKLKTLPINTDIIKRWMRIPVMLLISVKY